MAAKRDFIFVVDSIFKNKFNFSTLTEEEKESTFFIINRKFSVYKPKLSNYFNFEHIDKVSALDVWYQHFIDENINNIPGWYWQTNSTKKVETESNDFTKKEIELFTKYNDHFTQNDIKFLLKYYKDDVKAELKKLKKFE